MKYSEVYCFKYLIEFLSITGAYHIEFSYTLLSKLIPLSNVKDDDIKKLNIMSGIYYKITKICKPLYKYALANCTVCQWMNKNSRGVL